MTAIERAVIAAAGLVALAITLTPAVAQVTAGLCGHLYRCPASRREQRR